MNFNNMKVAARLGIGFGFVSILLLIVTALGISRMAQMKEKMDDINSNNIETKLVSTMYTTVSERALALRNLILLVDEAEDRKEANRIKDQTDKYAAAERKLSEMFATRTDTSAEEKSKLAQIKEMAIAAAPFTQKATELALANKSDEAYQLLRNEFRPVQKKWWDSLLNLIELQEKLSETAAAEADQAYEHARTLMLIFGGLALLSSAIAAWLITRGLQKQLGGEPDYAAAIAGKIAAGDLAVAIETRANDQSSLLFAIKSMRDNLAQIVSEVRTGADTIATASGQIASGNLDLSSRTEQQASSLEETASSMEELTSTVKQNADNARQANQLAVSASEVAVKGGAVVSQVVDTMGSINESARKIVDIIGVIDGIAFQTNILALNAAVEAARAGEQGRGFAVVASEVRNLAQRSAAAAKEIKTLIGDSVEKVDAGAKLVDQAGTTMDEIVESVKRVTDIMGEITAASQEQTSGIEQINQAITQMDEVTQQNASLVEQAAAASESLQDQAGNLSQVVSVFQLNGMHATAGAPSKTASRPALVAKRGSSPLPAVTGNSKRSAMNVKPLRRVANAPVAAAGSEWEEF